MHAYCKIRTISFPTACINKWRLMRLCNDPLMTSGEAGPELSPSSTMLGILDHCLLPGELLDTEHHVKTNFLTTGCPVQSLHCAQRKPLQGGCSLQLRISWILSGDVTWLRSRAGSLGWPLLTEAKAWANLSLSCSQDKSASTEV